MNNLEKISRIIQRINGSRRNKILSCFFVYNFNPQEWRRKIIQRDLSKMLKLIYELYQHKPY